MPITGSIQGFESGINLQVHAQDATLRVPLDTSSKAFERLEECFNSREALKTNPFVKRNIGEESIRRLWPEALKMSALILQFCCVARSPTRDARALASGRISSLLALEISPTGRATSD